MPPPGYQQGRAASRIGVSLSVHVDAHDLGVVLAAETGFLLSSNPDEVRAADVSFVSNDRLAEAQFQRQKYFPGAPNLLFEVLSLEGRANAQFSRATHEIEGVSATVSNLTRRLIQSRILELRIVERRMPPDERRAVEQDRKELEVLLAQANERP